MRDVNGDSMSRGVCGFLALVFYLGTHSHLSSESQASVTENIDLQQWRHSIPVLNAWADQGIIHDRTPDCHPVSVAWMHG